VIHVTNTLVRTLSPLFNELSWEIENSTEDPWDYTFSIHRSESEGGPWDALSGEFSDRYYFIDNNIPKYRTNRRLFYKIQTTKRSDSSTAWSSIFSVEGPINKYAAAISRTERLVFRKFAGQRIFVLPIRTFGFRCGCWDPVTGKRQPKTPECKLCYNTGFVGGYMSAIETYAQVSADPAKIIQSGGQEEEPKANNIVLTNYPLVKPYDLIIQPDLNIRWRIAVVSPTRLGGSLVHQNLTVSAVSKSDLEHKIRIDESEILQASRPEALSRMRTTI